jgi:hypothetical protein
MIYFSDFGSGFTAGDGVLAYRNATTSSGLGAVAEGFPAESYDRSAYHDTSSNTERLVIPSGVSLVRVVGSMDVTVGPIVTTIRKGGASFPGSGYRSIANIAIGGSVKSGPLAVSAGDYFEIYKENSANQTFTAAFNFLSVEVLSPSLSYAFVNKTGTQVISASVQTALTWDQDVVNVGGGWHSASSNNTRLTVPSGVSRIRITAGTKANSSVAGDMYLFLKDRTGSSTFVGNGAQTYTGSTVDKGLNIVTAILPVTGGTDWFEVIQLNPNATTVGGDRCWATIEDASSTVACLVTRSSSQAISATTWTNVQWNSQSYRDVTAMHDTSTNPSRLIVPPGYTQARVSFGLTSASTEIGGRVVMNGVTFIGMPTDWNSSLANGNINGMSAWIDVTAGDYFEVQAYCNTASNITNSPVNWACLEVR